MDNIQTQETTTPAPILTPMQKAFEALNDKPEEAKQETGAEAKAPSSEDSTQTVQAQPKTEESKEEIKARQFAELAKREKKILQKKRAAEEDLRRKEVELSQKEEQIRQEERKKIQESLKRKPTKTLEELGTPYNDITRYMLNGEKVTPEMVQSTAEQRIAELEKKIQETEERLVQREQQRQQEEAQRIVRAFNENCINTVRGNPERWELINHFNQTEVIPAMIEAHWNRTKRVMSIDEASDILEKDIAKQVETLRKTKFWNKLSSTEPKGTSQNTSLNKPKPETPKSQTITNELTATVPSLLPAATEAERMKRALAKLT